MVDQDPSKITTHGREPGAAEPPAEPSGSHTATAAQTLSHIEIEVDPNIPDDDHSISELSSSSTSLASSVRQYEWKHGRRYQSSGAYNFPNDEREQDRLDMLHHVFTLLIHGRLFLAPIDPAGKRVLDVGTGTGIWPIQFGHEHPDAKEVVGTDISPIQPEWVPPNVKFLVDDVEKEWVPDAEPWDLIHVRYMAASIQDWPRLVKHVFAGLAPGGWAEFQESVNTLVSEDGSLKRDNPMAVMMRALAEACDKIGRTLDPAPSLKGWMEEAGFVNVTVKKFKMPIGSWPRDPRMKEVGTLMGINFVEGVEAFTAVLLGEVLGWPKDEVAELNTGVKAAVRRRDVHPLFEYLVITGQKPE